MTVRKCWGAYRKGWFKVWGPALQLNFHLSVCKMFVRGSCNVHLTEVLGSSDFLLCEFTPKEEECFSKSAVTVWLFSTREGRESLTSPVELFHSE